MRLLTDNRAQSIQIGAVLLFGILIILLSTWQAFVVPDQNEEIEFNHNQDVQKQMTELRTTVNSMPDAASTRSATIDLGVRYPSRAIFRNPPPVSGTVSTIGDEESDFTIRLEAQATESTPNFNALWSGDIGYDTRAIEYRPGYNRYGDAPRTVFEHSTVFNRFDRQDTELLLADQAMLQGDRITLVTLNGSLRESRVDSTSIDFEPISTETRTIRIEPPDGEENIVLELSTTLGEDRWEEILDDHSVRDYQDRSDGVNTVTIELSDARDSYRLRLAQVGVGNNFEKQSESAYLTGISGDGETITEGQSQRLVVEVRDKFNGPVQGTTVEGEIKSGDGSLAEIQPESDEAGQAIFEYDSEGVSASSDGTNIDLEFWFDDRTDDAKSVEKTVTVEGSTGGEEPPYRIDFDENEIENEAGVTNCEPGDCTYDFSEGGTSPFDLHAKTTPIAVGANVDWSLNTTEYGTLTDEDGETDADGKATATFDPTDVGNLTSYVTSGPDGDSLVVRLVNTGERVELFSSYQSNAGRLNGADGDFLRVGFPEPVDTSGWQFNRTTGGTSDLPNEELQGEIFFPRDPAEFQETWSIDSARVYGLNFAVTNEDDHIELRDADGNLIDEFAYGSEQTSSGWSLDNSASGEVPYRQFFGGEYVDTDSADDWSIQDREAMFFNLRAGENTTENLEVDPGLVYKTTVNGDNFMQAIDEQQRVGFFDDANPTAYGPMQADLNGNGNVDVPYIDTDGERIELTDYRGNTETLYNSNMDSPQEQPASTRLTAGDLNDDGTSSVFAVLNGEIYRFEYGQDPENLNIEALAVAGVGDFTGDGDTDLVYVNTNDGLSYVEGIGGTEEPIGTFEIGGEDAVSELGDFNGDGLLEVAYVNENGDDIEYADPGGQVGSFGLTGGQIEAQPLGVGNFGGQDAVVWVHPNDDNRLYRVEDGGNLTPLDDEHGYAQDGNLATGVVGYPIDREVVEVQTGSFSGLVEDDGGDPIGEADVTFEAGDGTFSESVQTNADGTYVVNDVPEGTYDITASTTGYEDDTAAGVTINANEETENINFSLSGNVGDVSGTVTDTDGTAIEGATVTVDATGQSTQTDANGEYTIQDVPEGEQDITADADGYVPETQTVTVVDGDTVTQDFTLDSRTLSGEVTDEGTNEAIADATVTLTAEDGTERTVTTSADGTYAFDQVETGDVTVTANADGYESNSKSETIGDSDVAVTVNFALTAEPGSLEGRVTDSETGDGIEGATVTIEGTGQETTTDANGDYEFGTVDRGTYDVTVDHPDYLSETTEVTIGPGEDVTENFALDAVPSQIIASDANLGNNNKLTAEFDVETDGEQTYNFVVEIDQSGNKDVREVSISGGDINTGLTLTQDSLDAIQTSDGVALLDPGVYVDPTTAQEDDLQTVSETIDGTTTINFNQGGDNIRVVVD